jgi:hypothetical protein
MSETSEKESDEEMLVVEFPDFSDALGVIRDKGIPGALNQGFPSSSSQLQINGLDTGAPTCKIGSFEFTGTYEMTLGTRLYFSVKDNKSQVKEERDERKADEKGRKDGKGERDGEGSGDTTSNIVGSHRDAKFQGMGEKRLVFRLTKIGEEATGPSGSGVISGEEDEFDLEMASERAPKGRPKAKPAAKRAAPKRGRFAVDGDSSSSESSDDDKAKVRAPTKRERDNASITSSSPSLCQEEQPKKRKRGRPKGSTKAAKAKQQAEREDDEEGKERARKSARK